LGTFAIEEWGEAHNFLNFVAKLFRQTRPLQRPVTTLHTGRLPRLSIGMQAGVVYANEQNGADAEKQ
jgi:hypothetical protein